jgi:hypothetical protein
MQNFIIFDHVLTIYLKKKRDLDTGVLGSGTGYIN